MSSVRVEGYRTLRDATFRPGPVSALVGNPGTGKSNLLNSIRAALDPKSAPLTPEDVAWPGTDPIRIEVVSPSGGEIVLEGSPPSMSSTRSGESPAVLYLPARLRGETIIAPTRDPADREGLAWQIAAETIRPIDAATEQRHKPGTGEAALGLIATVDAWKAAGLTGSVVLIEEPELFLPPQSQRYLYRQLRGLAESGNQILFSTHSPSFLNVSRLHELVLTEHDESTGTRLVQPKALPPDEEFRAYSEFDATRSELFLARAAILVEGQTELLALPFVFHALGYDPDRERISIIECGGKPNIPLVANVAKTVGIPFLVVHDRDAPAGKQPNQSEQQLNRLVGEVAGANRIELAPDFEGVAGLKGHRNKPARAWRHLADMPAAEVPAVLSEIVERAVQLARQ